MKFINNQARSFCLLEREAGEVDSDRRIIIVISWCDACESESEPALRLPTGRSPPPTSSKTQQTTRPNAIRMEARETEEGGDGGQRRRRIGCGCFQVFSRKVRQPRPEDGSRPTSDPPSLKMPEHTTPQTPHSKNQIKDRPASPPQPEIQIPSGFMASPQERDAKVARTFDFATLVKAFHRSYDAIVVESLQRCANNRTPDNPKESRFISPKSLSRTMASRVISCCVFVCVCPGSICLSLSLYVLLLLQILQRGAVWAEQWTGPRH